MSEREEWCECGHLREHHSKRGTCHRDDPGAGWECSCRRFRADLREENKELRAENDRIWAEVVRWRTATETADAERREHLAEIERLRRDVRGQTKASQSAWRVADTFRERVKAAEAQVAAVRALAEELTQDEDFANATNTCGYIAGAFLAALSSSEPVSADESRGPLPPCEHGIPRHYACRDCLGGEVSGA